MGLMVSGKGGSGDFEPLPAGTYIARCVSVVDIGIQQTPFGGKEKVYLGFEVASERVTWEKDGESHEGPALIGSRYTMSIHEKSILGQHLTGWRGKPFTEEEREAFDLFAVLDAPCMIGVIHKTKGEKTYANIQSIMRLPAGTVCPPAETDVIGYTPQDNAYSGNFDKLPEWLQKLCSEGHSAAQPVSQPPPLPQTDMSPPGDDYFDDDLPF